MTLLYDVISELFPWQTSTNIRLIKKTKPKSGTNKNSTESKLSETMQTQLKQSPTGPNFT